MSLQQPLPLGLDQELTFERFLPGQNGEVLRHLESASKGTSPMPVYLHGPSGSGKTHLLQATCSASSQRDFLAMVVPLRLLMGHDPSALQGLEEIDCICLDDLECVLGHKAWEEKLFQLFNALQERSAQLILAARLPPGSLGFLLEDLRSRFASGLILGLKPLSDEETVIALIEHASGLGLELPETGARYLMNRVQRDLGSLLAHLDALDRASMAAGRKLTIPFIREYLAHSP